MQLDEEKRLAILLAHMSERIARLERCLGFFASVIKSGEPWTETCEREYRAALQEKDKETNAA